MQWEYSVHGYSGQSYEKRCFFPRSKEMHMNQGVGRRGVKPAGWLRVGREERGAAWAGEVRVNQRLSLLFFPGLAAPDSSISLGRDLNRGAELST